MKEVENADGAIYPIRVVERDCGTRQQEDERRVAVALCCHAEAVNGIRLLRIDVEATA